MEGAPVPSPVGDAILTFGALSVAVVALVELYALGYYGLRFSTEISAFDNMVAGTWSETVKSNIHYTYVYLFASYYICIVAAGFVFSTPNLFSIFSWNLMVLVDFVVETIVQQGKIFTHMDSVGVFSSQKLAWCVYCAFLGGLASPAALFGPNAVRVAIHITLFIALMLIIISLTAPVGKFAAWDKNLKIGEIIVLIGSIGSSLLPINTTPGAVAFTISFYGGFILFQLFFLCHSQEAQITAQNSTAENPYCPPAMAVPMLLDTISIFSRIVLMVPPE